MKKIFLVLISIALLSACSNDDDVTPPDDGSRIVGTWFLIDAQSGSLTNTLSECNQNSFITFSADGTSESEFYEENESSCELETSSTGSWQYLGDSQYTFEVAGFGESTGTVNFVSNTRMTYASPDFAPFTLVFEK